MDFDSTPHDEGQTIMDESSVNWMTKRYGVVLFVIALLSCYASAGCMRSSTPPKQTDTKNDGSSPEPTPVKEYIKVEPSFAALGEPVSKDSDIPWTVAITLAEVSRASYDAPDDQVSEIKKIGATTVKPLVVGLAHGVVASNDKVVVIGFRGTKVPADWLTDATIIGHRTGDGKIHRGFFNVVDAIYKEAFNEAIRQGAKEKTVWITGHSLGGAMAIVFAHRSYTESELDPTAIITFGQPLAFSNSLAQFLLDKFDTRYIRFVNSWDPVPRLLPNYRHAGSRIYMQNGEFAFRKPMLSYSAPANPEPDAPLYHFSENVPELEPMSEDEFQQFQQQLEAEKKPQVVGAVGEVPVGAISIPWYEAHSMVLYIDRIREFGEKELNSVK